MEQLVEQCTGNRGYYMKPGQAVPGSAVKCGWSVEECEG